MKNFFPLLLLGILLGVAITYFYGHIPFLLYSALLVIGAVFAIKIRKRESRRK